MTKKDLDFLLKSSDLPRAALLYGDCAFLVDYYAKALQDSAKSSCGAEVVAFYPGDYDKEQITEALSQGSLFAASNLIDIRLEPDTKNHKAFKSGYKEAIKGFLKQLKNSPHRLIVRAYGGDKEAKDLGVLFEGAGFIAVRFFAPTPNEALAILTKIAREVGANIAPDALSHLYATQNSDISLAANELKKLATLPREITKDDIDALCYGLFSNSIDELCEALLLKKDYLKIAAKLDEQGVSDTDLINAMQFYFYRLFLCFAGIKTEGRLDSLKALGYKPPPQVETKYANLSMKLREAHYLRLFSHLNAWKCAVISGRDKNPLANLIKIQALLG